MSEIRTVTQDGVVYVCLADVVAGINEGETTVPWFDPALWLRTMLRRTEVRALTGEPPAQAVKA